jgi:hypothetical protein
MRFMRRRPLLASTGLLLSVLWLVCWAATVVPGSAAVTMQWVAGNAMAALAGAAFGAAAATRSK